jgi:hypothetical protein
MLTEAEFEAVLRTHYSEICGRRRAALPRVPRQGARHHTLPAARAAAQGGAARRQPRASEAGTSMKKQIFASALKRVNREIGRLEEAECRPTLAESARRVLELKRDNRVRHHPSAGRAASHGMRPLPNERDTARVDPREIGRVSQAVNAAQAHRDR